MTHAQPCCLVVEDQALIGIALEAYLEDEGFLVAGPFARGADALSWTERNTPTVAILDYKLRDGTCTELARSLTARDVPVVIYSGWPKGPDTPAALRGLTWLQKPADRPAMLAALALLSPALAQWIAPVPSWDLSRLAVC
jgi:DNA-binding response OmpR family regulator